MIKIKGHYFDGKSSTKVAVIITVQTSGNVQIAGDDVEINTTIKQLKISARLGNTPRNFYLGTGAKIVTDDNEAVDKICAYFDKNILQTLLHKVENKGSIVLLSLIGIVIFVWGGIEYGVPWAAKKAVKGVPYKMEKRIGEEGLETLDKWIFSKSALNETEQIRVQKQFEQLVKFSEKPDDFRLEFRSSEQMGANALALPGGIIIVTDDLIKLAENDEQLIAVFAHEMAHIKYQHGLRSLFQDSMTALFMAGFLGDISSISSLSVAIPTLLVETRYSREFEIEADQYAVDYLQLQQIPVEEYTTILSLLEQPIRSKYEFDYLSSHPAMELRIKKILNTQ